MVILTIRIMTKLFCIWQNHAPQRWVDIYTLRVRQEWKQMFIFSLWVFVFCFVLLLLLFFVTYTAIFIETSWPLSSPSRRNPTHTSTPRQSRTDIHFLTNRNIPIVTTWERPHCKYQSKQCPLCGLSHAVCLHWGINKPINFNHAHERFTMTSIQKAEWKSMTLFYIVLQTLQIDVLREVIKPRFETTVPSPLFDWLMWCTRICLRRQIVKLVRCANKRNWALHSFLRKTKERRNHG